MEKLSVNGREKAKEASVKYEEIFEGQFPDEAIITLSTSEGKLTAILPLSSIDRTTDSIIVYVIDEKEDLFLVDLPTYTFTSGSRAWFAKNAVSLKGRR